MGPCEPWPLVWMCDLSAVSPTVTGQAAQAATEILDALSGRQFGECPVTIRPCRRSCGDIPAGWLPWPGYTYPTPALIAGRWYNLTCGCSWDGCSCTSLAGKEVALPAPVSAVTTVLVDGAPLATGSYRVDDNRLLVRTDGNDWPACNDLTKDDTEVGTWSVTLTVGQPVPQIGKLAAGELACEIVSAFNGEDCRLPKAVQSLVRQGVTMSWPSMSEMLKDGRTGMYLTDMFIQATNPHGLKQRSKVHNVDAPTRRRAGT